MAANTRAKIPKIILHSPVFQFSSPIMPAVPRRRKDTLLPRRQWALVENHPVQTEPILYLPKAEGKERFFHRHQDTAAVGQRGENALRLDIAIHSQRQVSAAHRFSPRDVRRHQLVIANYNAGMQHRVLPFWPDTALVGRLRVRHHHANLCSEMPLVVAEGLRTVATEIHVSIHSHKLFSSFNNSRDRCFQLWVGISILSNDLLAVLR